MLLRVVFAAFAFAFLSNQTRAIEHGEPILEELPGMTSRAVGIETAKTRCSGAYYSSTVIITAAHCFTKPETAVINVKAGSVRVVGGVVPASKVREIVIHPEFTGKKRHVLGDRDPYDIALLKLESMAGRNFAPLQILDNEQDWLKKAVFPDTIYIDVVVYGFSTGKIAAKKRGTSLQSIYDPFTYIPEMKKGMATRPLEEAMKHPLGEEDHERWSCSGDSGAPIFVNPAAWDDEGIDMVEAPVLVGVGSGSDSGEKNCGTGMSYVRPELAREWILNTTKAFIGD